jgi:hypothetical protein
MMGQGNVKLKNAIQALRHVGELLDAGQITAAHEVVAQTLAGSLPPDTRAKSGNRTFDAFDGEFRKLSAGHGLAAAYVIFEPEGDRISVFSGGDRDVHRYVVDRLGLAKGGE